MITFETSPEKYRHWKLNIDGGIASLTMDVQEDAPLSPEYRLKLNSYDLGVDIELADAAQRLRFEHPGVKAVVIASAKDNIFCAGANIFMLGASSHAFKMRVYGRGRIANWIAPPERGINGKPFDFEYVRFE